MAENEQSARNEAMEKMDENLSGLGNVNELEGYILGVDDILDDEQQRSLFSKIVVSS